MKKKRLEIEYTYDFDLIGIISSVKGYKLAWDINNQLLVRLIKQPDLLLHIKNESIPYQYFAYDNEVNTLKLFKNRPTEMEGKFFLVPEHPHFDYIMMVAGEAFEDRNRLQELLRNISSIELAAFIPLAPLKSKDNFIF